MKITICLACKRVFVNYGKTEWYGIETTPQEFAIVQLISTSITLKEIFGITEYEEVDECTECEKIHNN